MPVYTFRPAKQILEWLRKKPNRTAVINDALQRYKDGEPLPQEIVERLDEFGITLEDIRKQQKEIIEKLGISETNGKV